MKRTGEASSVARAFAAGSQIFIITVVGGATLWAQTMPAGTVAALTAPTSPAPAGSAAGVVDVESAPADNVRLLVGRSALVDVGSPIARVSLTSADIADALVTSQSQLLVHGKGPGAISMFVWGRNGNVRRFEVSVQRDLAKLTEQVKQLFPSEGIDVRANGRSVVLAGTVSTKDVIERATNVALGYVEKKEDVVSLLQVREARASNQVLLRVRFAEVSRTALTEFGMNFFTSPTGIKNTLGTVGTGQYPNAGFSDLAWTKGNSDFGGPVTSSSGKLDLGDMLNLFFLNQKYDLGAMIRAMQQRGLFQSLAEPNLVAESGKEASFLAGGEFPIPVVQGGASNAVTVQFKEFGVRLNFTPTVIGDRVHLKVRPEVSTLDFANGVNLNGFRIPALSTRRTETELELRNGQTFAIAGLMNNNLTSTMQKVPGIGDIPILGQLFRSKAAQKAQTELVVMITPEILPVDSDGVTATLPRLPEPYLAPMPEKRTAPSPAPAFTPERRSSISAPAAVRVEDAERRQRDEARKVDDELKRQEAQRLQGLKALEKTSKEQARQQREEAEAQNKRMAEAQRTQDAQQKKLEKEERERAKQEQDAAAKAARDAERAAKKAGRQAESDQKAQPKPDTSASLSTSQAPSVAP